MENDFDEIIRAAENVPAISEQLRGWIETAKLTVCTGRRHYAYIKYDNGNGIMHDTLTGKPLDCGFYEPEYIDAPNEVLPDCVRLRFMLVYKLGENYDVRFFKTREEARSYVAYLAKVQRGEIGTDNE